MPDHDFAEVGYARRGVAGWITLQRPGKRNALTPTMVAGLHRALDLADRDAEVAAVVITGAGPAFCAGADLDFFQSLSDADDGCDRFMSGLLRPLVDFLARLRSCERPVIAAVNGACAAGGLEMVLCCDLIVASSEATFSDAHSRRGIAPAIGGAAGLVRSLGAHRAKQLLLLADNYDADTMAALGLVAEVVAPAELLNRVEVMTETLGRRSPDSLRLAKRMVHRSQDPDWDRNVEADLTDFRNGWGSADMREGMRAYVEHRQPAFRR